MTASDDITRLNNLASYLNSIAATTGTLQSAATALGALVPADDLVNGNNVTQINSAYNAIYPSGGSGPSDWAIGVATVAADIQTMQQQITHLQAQLAAPAPSAPIMPMPILTPKPIVPAPKQAMSNTAAMVGIASVLLIGGGLWWSLRHDKVKAKEAHAAGAFRKKNAVEAEEDDE